MGSSHHSAINKMCDFEQITESLCVLVASSINHRISYFFFLSSVPDHWLPVLGAHYK